ncbi:nuclear factor 7, brain-like [Anableps anableps]
MAERALLERYLSCVVCLEIFTEPVTLSCNHSFCSGCLQKCWEQTANKNCLICGKRSSIKTLSVSAILKDLAESFARIQKSESVDWGKQEKLGDCRISPEYAYIFWEDVKMADCPHSEVSLNQDPAVSELKEQLKSELKSLQDKRSKHRQMEKTYEKMAQHLKIQVFTTERQIRAEFNKLHQLLKEEEESRLTALREEEEQKGKIISREMKRIQEQISSLSYSISAVEEELQKDKVSFLSSYEATQSRARAQSSLPDPQLVPGALIDVAKHLGNLSFRVWEKMKEKVHFSPVILDPNTAYPKLHLSDDLTSVRHGDKWQQLPDNPERNTNYPTVFGSEGFSSGTHSWEVEVGDHPAWNVGLVKESADRKEYYSASPKFGVWCLWHGSGIYANSEGKTVTDKKSLQRIRVQLDYDGGEVSFYDPEDMTRICSYTDTFTKKLFPYFSIAHAGDSKPTYIKISKMSVTSAKLTWLEENAENNRKNVENTQKSKPGQLSQIC